MNARGLLLQRAAPGMGSILQRRCAIALVVMRVGPAAALPFFVKAASLGHQAAHAYHLAGSPQYELGNIDEAIVSYVKAAALDPSLRECCYRMVPLLHEKIGRMDEAVRYYKKAIQDSRGRTGEKAA